MLDTEEDLALGDVKHVELWQDSASDRMVVFANDGSKKLVQFDVQVWVYIIQIFTETVRKCNVLVDCQESYIFPSDYIVTRGKYKSLCSTKT